jgi:hypothetical protein
MPGICRHAVCTDPGVESARFDHPLFAVVALETERLHGAQPESVPIAAVWLDVVNNAGDHAELATRGAGSAERLNL